MTANDSPLKTTSSIGGIRAPASFQAIEAKYYNVTDRGGMPIAGLLVLQDRLQRPVRAELHLYDDLEDSMREAALRQSQLILQDRYYSREPVQLRVMHTFPERSAVDVPLPASQATKRAAAGGKSGGVNWKMVAGVIIGLLLVAAIIWGVSRFMGQRQTASSGAAAPVVSAPAESSPQEGAQQAPESAASTENASAPQTNGLPPSKNAHPDLAVGQTISVAPGYQITLRSEPGAESGVDVAYMKEGEEAVIIGGPVWTQGDADTIVWWQVQLPDGTEAWAPANTSQLRLLEPVE
jgi:hypothetical protein